jgi:hypothetical protein
MKKYIFSFMAVIGFLMASPAHASYSYYMPITISTSTSIASGTNANFPMLVSSTISQWKPVSAGGHVQNLTTSPIGIQEPADFIFATSTACASSLNFETEAYTSSTGLLVDWVNVPSLSAGSVIYACYGNGSVSTDQSHPSSTWNSNYAAVYHLADVGNATTTDSTSNKNNGTVSGVAASSTSYIDGGAVFTSANSISAADSASLDVSGNTITLSGWQKETDNSNGYATILAKEPSTCSNPYQYYGLFQGQAAGIGLFSFSLGAGGTQNLINQFNLPVNINTWNYYVGTYDGATMREYYNGALVASKAVSGNIGTGATPLRMGLTAGCSETFTGSEDEVRVSNASTSPSWILTEYNNQSSPSTFYSIGTETANSGGGGSIIQQILNYILTWDW